MSCTTETEFTMMNILLKGSACMKKMCASAGFRFITCPFFANEIASICREEGSADDALFSKMY